MTTPGYSAITFDTAGFDNEILIALLAEWPVESFHDDGNRVIAYIHEGNITPELLDTIEQWKAIRYAAYTLAPVPDQNWNALWESSFSPVAVDAYCYIRASFHAPPPVGVFRHEVVIAPRMAFGTGHHATTYMMLQAMAELDFHNKTVLDFGCGTGILAVVAAMEGAASITGIDIQPEAIENSAEHAALNHVSQHCRFYGGDLALVKDQTFDIILANINATVIAAHIGELKKMLRPGGYLLLSGIMIHDREFMQQHIPFSPLKVIAQREQGEWLLCKLKAVS